MQLLDQVEALAKEKSVTPAQIALAWLMAQGKDITPIPGSKSRKHLEENLKAIDIKLTEDDVARVEVIKTANAMLGAISNMCMAEIFYWLKKGGLTEEDFQNFIRSSQNYSTALDRITQIMMNRNSLALWGLLYWRCAAWKSFAGINNHI